MRGLWSSSVAEAEAGAFFFRRSSKFPARCVSEEVMTILRKLTIGLAALVLVAAGPTAEAATAAGAAIKVNGKDIGGFTITRKGESRADLVRQLSKRAITFERDFKVPVDAKNPDKAILKGEIKFTARIRGDREVMAEAKELLLVRKKGRWYVDEESFKQALKPAKKK